MYGINFLARFVFTIDRNFMESKRGAEKNQSADLENSTDFEYASIHAAIVTGAGNAILTNSMRR